MARFEREDIEARPLPPPLGTATEGLRTTIEAEVAKIVERAEARAAEIETRALEKASRIEEGSEARARDVFRDARERLGQMMAEIDAIERSVGQAVRSLRTEAERLNSEIETAKESPLEVPEPEPPVAAAAPDEPIAEEEPPPQPVPQPQPEPEEEPATSEAQDPAVREMIRQQLLSLAESGRTRPDAERMLLRFKQGEQYHDLLDEIYPQQPAGRRGLLRRRKS